MGLKILLDTIMQVILQLTLGWQVVSGRRDSISIIISESKGISYTIWSHNTMNDQGLSFDCKSVL